MALTEFASEPSVKATERKTPNPRLRSAFAVTAAHRSDRGSLSCSQRVILVSGSDSWSCSIPGIVTAVCLRE
jgi:hypothetical protein